MLGRVAGGVLRSSAFSAKALKTKVAKPLIRTVVQLNWISDKAALENLKFNVTVSTKLNELRDAPGAKKKALRVGRGRGGRRGKTGGRGQDGQTGRQGGHIKRGFEGGQTPLYKKVRKYGFTNNGFKRTTQAISLARLQYWIDTGRIDASKPINMYTLIRSGCAGSIRKRDVGIKLLSDGAEWFSAKINIELTSASKKAFDTIKAKGGNIKLVYYNRTGLQALLHPEKYDHEGHIEPPQNLRKLPYLPPPPAHILRRLDLKFEQPTQFPGWLKRQQKLVEKAKEAGETVPEATMQLIEKVAAELKA